MKRLGLTGLAFVGGLSLFGCGGERQQPYLNTGPVVQEITTSEFTQKIRGEWKEAGIDIKKGYNGRKLSKFFYSSEEAWPVWLDSNIARGKIGYVQTLLEVPDPLSWNGINYIPYRFHALMAGDHLDFLDSVVSSDGITYRFQPPVSLEQLNFKIDNPNGKVNYPLTITRSTLKGLAKREN